MYACVCASLVDATIIAICLLRHIGDDNLFPTQRRWFAATEDAVTAARAILEASQH